MSWTGAATGEAAPISPQCERSASKSTRDGGPRGTPATPTAPAQSLWRGRLRSPPSATVVPQGPSAADLRAERLRVARERQEALCKQMDAESREPVVNPEPEAPRAAEVLRIPTDGTPEQIAAAALRIAEQHGLPPPTKRASAEESKCEEEEEPIAREGYETVARILAAVGETRLLPLFEAQEIDDVVLPSLKPTDLVDLGVSPGACLAILGPSAGKAKKIEASAEAILHDVATHQSVLEDELRHHRAEIERLRISRDELPVDLCCPITCELMKDPVITADGTTFERCAIQEWFSTGARTSPTTNEPLENLTLIPNHVCKRLINALMEERSLTA